MVGAHWYVYPVEDGIELVIDSSDGDVYDKALAEFVTHFLDYDLVAEWSVDGAEVLRFVAAPPTVPAVRLPAQRTASRAAQAR